MRPNNAILLNAVANTGTQTGNAVSILNMFTASIQAVFSSTSATGILEIQASNDSQSNLPGNEAAQNWSDITSLLIANGNSQYVVFPNLTFQYIRAKWTSLGGTGTITVTASMQGV